MGVEGDAGAEAPAARVGPTAVEWGLAVLLLGAFAPALIGLSGVWRSVDYQSHGFLVPVVSYWVAARERYRLARLPRGLDRRGLALLVPALLAYAVGLGLGSVSLQGLALVAAAAGAVWLARGSAWLRGLAFPLGYLVFMVPVPPAWITPTIVKLQLFVSSVSVALLRAFGSGVERQGNVLVLPSGDTLFVAEACSGVTSIVTLMPLGVLLAYLTLRRAWTATLLVVAVVPLAMAGNLTRVVTTVVAAQELGVEIATEGPPHELAGLLTYAVACGLMLLLGGALRRLERAGAGAPARA